MGLGQGQDKDTLVIGLLQESLSCPAGGQEQELEQEVAGGRELLSAQIQRKKRSWSSFLTAAQR